ncbi:peptidase M66 family protein, partial [Vibrio parahaemolyticus EKP-026]
TRCLIAYQLQ